MFEQQVAYRRAVSQREVVGHTAVRWDVFVAEQNVPPVLEIDARDFSNNTVHIVAELISGEIVGAARLILDPPGEGDQVSRSFHVGRVAVRPQWRGKGVGAGIMHFACQVAEEQSPSGASVELVLDAQVEAEGFYRRLGYQPTDRKPFYDAGILHQEMKKLTLGTA